MEDGLFQSMASYIDKALADLSQGYTSQYASILISVAVSAIILHFSVKAYAIIAGKIQAPVTEIVWDGAKIAIIMAFVTNNGGILDAALSAIDGLKTALASNEGESIFVVLDKQLSSGQELATTLSDKDDSWVPLEGVFSSLLAWGGVFVGLLFPALLLFTTTITLKLLTITAPIFIFCMLFGFLKNMFAQWLQLILSNILTLVFLGLVVKLSIRFFESNIAELQAQTDDANLLLYGSIVLVMGVIVAVFSKITSSIAQSLASVSIEAVAASATSSAFGQGVGYGKAALNKSGVTALATSARAGAVGGASQLVKQSVKPLHQSVIRKIIDRNNQSM